MADMKPVAWKHTVIRDNVITHDPADIRTHPERWMPLFSTTQLRQAKVEVLREVAEKWNDDTDDANAYRFLRRMADELEK